MSQLSIFLADLEKFSADENINSVIERLKESSPPDDKKAREQAESLRVNLLKLTEISKYRGMRKGGVKLTDVIYNMLIVLATTYPLNSQDPILFDNFSDDAIKVVCSTGHVYDLRTLIYYHQSRHSRYTDLGESEDDKWLLNPATNLPFSEYDVERFLAAAKLSLLSIPNLITAKKAFEIGNVKVTTDDPRGINFSKGEKLLQLAAKAGNADAAYLLAKIYCDEFAGEHTFRMGGPAWWGKKQDYRLAKEYLNMAIALDSQDARFEMVAMLFRGQEELGVKPDMESALHLLNELVDEGYIKAILAKIELLSSSPMQEDTTDLESMLEEVDDYADKLRIIEDLGEKGNVKALKRLIQLYEEGGRSLDIEPDPEQVKYYTAKLNDAVLSKYRESILLLEKAASLGHAESIHQLALLYLGSTSVLNNKIEIVDIEKGMHYLKLALSHGSHKAATILAKIYSHNRYIFIPDLPVSVFEEFYENIPYDPISSLEILQRGYRLAESDNDKGEFAYKIANAYLEIKDVFPRNARLIEIIKYFEIAVKMNFPDAIISYGKLLLSGNHDIGLNSNPERADEVFHLMKSGYYFKIGNYLSSIASDSMENFSRYLYWTFKLLEEPPERYYDVQSCLAEIIHLLEHGYINIGYEANRKPVFPINQKLAGEYKSLIKNHPYFNGDRSYDERKGPENAWPSNQVQALMKKTYAHFKLGCPFDESFAKDVSISHGVPGRSFVKITRNRPNPCLIFSGNTFRRVNDASVVSPPRPGASTNSDT